LLEHGWFIRTATIMFPRIALKNIPEWFFHSYSTDYILHILLAENGQIVRLEDITAVYRRHPKGISVASIEVQQRRWVDKLKLLKKIDEYFSYKYTANIKKQSKAYLFAIGISLLRDSKIWSSRFSGIKYINKAGFVYSLKIILVRLGRKMRTA